MTTPTAAAVNGSDQLVVQVFSSVFSSVAFYYAQTKASEFRQFIPSQLMLNLSFIANRIELSQFWRMFFVMTVVAVPVGGKSFADCGELPNYLETHFAIHLC